jgi:hypothetical protein
MTENWPSRYPDKQAAISSERCNIKPSDKEYLQFSTPILDPHETTSPKRLKPTYRQQFLQSCESEYDATAEAYEQIYPHPSDRPRYALNECRRFAYFALDRTSGNVKVMSNGCRDRWCPMCAGQKSKFARESVQSWVETLEEPRFLTLTLEHCEDDLLPQVEFLQDAFRRLRYRAFWKRNVFGGVWFLQVHRSKNDGCWHPHLHILLEGKYMEKHELSDLWKLVTFGSYILKIKRVHDVERTAKYVARYTARPAKLADMLLADRVEMIKTLKGKRLCGTFGNAKVITLTPPKVESGADWVQIDYYDTLVEKSATDKNAMNILLSWCHEYPISDELFEAYTGHPVVVPFVKVKEKEQIQYLLDFYNTS